MMAIGVPALITGSLNTTTSVDTVSSQAKENQALVKQLQEIANIPTLPAGGITPLSLNENDDGVTQGQRGLAWLDMVGITEAQAASPGEKKGAMAVGITIDEPLYYIVLQVTASKEAAKQQAQQLQADIPSVIAVQSGTQYLILYSKNPVKRADAVLITLKVKQRFQLQPKLMPAQ